MVDPVFWKEFEMNVAPRLKRRLDDLLMDKSHSHYEILPSLQIDFDNGRVQLQERIGCLPFGQPIETRSAEEAYRKISEYLMEHMEMERCFGTSADVEKIWGSFESFLQ